MLQTPQQFARPAETETKPLGWTIEVAQIERHQRVCSSIHSGFKHKFVADIGELTARRL